MEQRKSCGVCGKGSMQRNSVSHARNTFVRHAHANLRRMRVTKDGQVRQIWICAKCLKRGTVVPALARRLSRPPAASAA